MMSEENKEPEAVEEEVLDTTDVPQYVEPYEMEMSPAIGQLAGALAKAQGNIKNGSKDTKAHNYKYMELDQVIDLTKVPLSENELALVQSHEVVKRPGQKIPNVITTTLLAHSSGEWIKSRLELPVTPSKMLNKAQMIGVAATYGRRYSMIAMVGVAAERDSDANVPK